MGLLFHGLPGCGKTSTIKAIANYTQRHIVSVPLNKIKTCKELLDIFYNNRMNMKDIPLQKRLYVLEDIDCHSLKNVVTERSDEETKSCDLRKAGEKNEDVASLLNLFKIPTAKVFDDSQKLSLAGLLEVLDGVMEMDGRMLVITTNYPEKLDKALIRPGRIDMKIEFGRCTSDCLAEMYKNFFQMALPDNFDRSSLPNRKWTPAEAAQVFLNNMHHPPTGLQQLVSQTPEANIL